MKTNVGTYRQGNTNCGRYYSDYIGCNRNFFSLGLDRSRAIVDRTLQILPCIHIAGNEHLPDGKKINNQFHSNTPDRQSCLSDVSFLLVINHPT